MRGLLAGLLATLLFMIIQRLIGTALAAMMTLSVFAQEPQPAPDYRAYILTPPAPAEPRINGPKVYGARPGADFLFRIPATGERPMTFEAKGLPRGLKLDPATGIISGRIRPVGARGRDRSAGAQGKDREYRVTLIARNARGEARRELRIVVGGQIALTPPMGWNSWNLWGNTVSQEKVEAAARAMVESGLADYGWSYINIDDGWQGVRGGKYNAIQPNGKFPDMAGMVDRIHALGLKAGIYSSPWCGTYAGHIGTTCDREDGIYWWVEQGIVDADMKLDRKQKAIKREDLRYFGEYSFARQDARQWADWGIDYLKYDWNPNDRFYLKQMRDAIDATGRDILYSVSCTAKIGMGPYLSQYAEAWRTTNDIRDNWESVSEIGFRTHKCKGQDQWAPYKRPGSWPDADMLVVGKLGWWSGVHWTGLTPDEQYTHITLWSILASPLLLGCDLTALDPFTLSLLCNSEVIDVNQDPLGLQASRVAGDETHAIYVKPLEDGSLAVALFNLGDEPRVMGFVPRLLGIVGEQTFHDLWRQQDIGKVNPREKWETVVAPHGTVFLQIRPGIDDVRRTGSVRKTLL